VVQKKAAVCGEERCVTSLKTAAKETTARGTVNIMQIRERNEEGMGRDREKTDYGGFFVIQIPVPEKRKIPIGYHLSIC